MWGGGGYNKCLSPLKLGVRIPFMIHGKVYLTQYYVIKFVSE